MNHPYLYNRIFSCLAIALLSVTAIAFTHESNPHPKETTPYSWDFGANQTGIIWPEKEFTITNTGIGTLYLEPSDLSITGEHASEFVLSNIDAPVSLEPYESTTIGVSFSPQTVGVKFALFWVDNTQVPLSGEAFDNSISSFPHFMDFNDAVVPELPPGWTSYVESTHASARIETTTLVNPVTPPNQLRYININDPNAILLFISPPIAADLNQLRVSFYAKGLEGTNNSVEVGTYSYDENGGYTPVAMVGITDANIQYQVDLNEYQGNDTHLVIRAVPEASVRPVYLDNLQIALIPSEPIVEVTPDSWEFDPTHYGESSEEKQFTITNTGGATLVLSAADITLTGEDASDFTLNNLTETVELTTNQSTTIGVVFTPDLEGDKTATLMVKEFEVTLTGESYNPHITNLPHSEDFNNVTTPELPFGWTKHMETTSGQATVQTSHLSGPNSPPYHIRFGNFIDPDADLFLISPEIEFDLSTLRVSFYSKVNIDGPSYIEVGTWNPDANESFTMLTSFHLTEEYTHFFYEFDEYEGEDIHIAFRADFAQSYRWVMLDDFLLDYAPLSAIINVTPGSHAFAPIQVGTLSNPKDFTIINDGGDTLVVSPSNITLTGNHADAFTLQNLENEVQLLAGETATISVTFAPATVGNKEAILTVNDFEVPLTGEAFDATIAEFPWEEDFSGLDTGEIPLGWIKDSDNWGANLTSNAGGNAPEMRFYFVPILEGTFTLQSPWINTSEFDELLLSFRHMVDNYQTPGIYNLKVVTIVGDEVHIIQEWEDPDNIPAESFSAVITAAEHGIGSETLRIAFVFEGATEDINQWYIDDIALREVPEYYTVSFNILEDSDEQAPVEGVTINIAGAVSLTTDENGFASASLETGSYSAEIIKAGFASQSVDFTLADEDIAIDIFLLDEIAAPANLAITTEGLDHGQALLSWDQEKILHESRTSKAFSGFTVYLNENAIAENIAEQQYLFENLEPGDYTAGVRAMYTTGESEMATLDFTIEEPPLLFTVTFEVENEQGEAVPDAIITLNSTTAQPGEYLFENLEAGTYDFAANKEGYLETSGQLTIVDEDLFIGVILTEDDVAIDNPQTLTMSIYPNPANNMINIKNHEKIFKLRIMDILGQVVHFSQPQTEQFQIDISELREGVYFVQILTTEGYTVQKVQIAR